MKQAGLRAERCSTESARCARSGVRIAECGCVRCRERRRLELRREHVAGERDRHAEGIRRCDGTLAVINERLAALAEPARVGELRVRLELCRARLRDVGACPPSGERRRIRDELLRAQRRLQSELAEALEMLGADRGRGRDGRGA